MRGRPGGRLAAGAVTGPGAGAAAGGSGFLRGRPRGRLRGTAGGTAVFVPKFGRNVVVVVAVVAEPLATGAWMRAAGCVLGRTVRVAGCADDGRPTDFDRDGRASGALARRAVLAALVFDTPRGGPTLAGCPGRIMGTGAATVAAGREAERPRRVVVGPDSMRAVDDRPRLRVRAGVASRRGTSGEGVGLRPRAGVLRLPRLMLRVRGVWGRPRDTLRVRRGAGFAEGAGVSSSSSSSSGTGTRKSW